MSIYVSCKLTLVFRVSGFKTVMYLNARNTITHLQKLRCLRQSRKSDSLVIFSFNLCFSFVKSHLSWSILHLFFNCFSWSVFKSKVLQRLYPATPELEKKPSQPRCPENSTNKAYVNKKTLKDGPVIGKNANHIHHNNTQSHSASRDTLIMWLLLFIFCNRKESEDTKCC